MKNISIQHPQFTIGQKETHGAVELKAKGSRTDFSAKAQARNQFFKGVPPGHRGGLPKMSKIRNWGIGGTPKEVICFSKKSRHARKNITLKVSVEDYITAFLLLQ